MGKDINLVLNEIPCSIEVAVELGDFELADRKVSAEERKELLRASRAGEPMRLSVLASVFLQHMVPCPLPKRLRSKANANFSRFRDEELEPFAKSFTGQLFLRDHDRYSMAAVGGRIVESQAVKVSDAMQFHQRLELVKPWAIEDALDGTMRTFSIGWSPKKPGWNGFRESLLCSVCDASFFDCSHFPGDEISPTEGGKFQEAVIVEALWVNVRGAETSEVAFPAVRGTEVKDIRAALSEARKTLVSVSAPAEERIMKGLLAILGLASTATEEEAVAAAKALAARAEAAETARAEAVAASEAADETVAELRSKLTALQGDVRGAEVRRLHDRALSEMLFAKGSKREAYFLTIAKRDPAEAEAYLATLDPVVPGAGDSQAERAVDDKSTSTGLTARQKKWAAQMGMSEEQYQQNLEKGGVI